MGKKLMTLRSKQRIPVSPEIVIDLNSNVTAAYYYTQLLFYDKYERKNSDGWFGKTSAEIEADIGLKRRRQENSRKLLESKGWIETRSIMGGKKPAVQFRVLIVYTSD